ncbi:MAG: phosphoribosyl-ATP diphosphatase [Pelagibacterales bacterium]|nr:phosphoribosyl-ATP diphosphatase [Pelagibacterales bacterium]
MSNVLFDLEKVINKNKNKNIKQSYTAFLFKKGKSFSIKKLNEEFKELKFSLKKKNRSNIIHESADLIYHLMVLLVFKKIKLHSIFNELKKRTKLSGIEEKRRRTYVRSK